MTRVVVLVVDLTPAFLGWPSHSTRIAMTATIYHRLLSPSLRESERRT